MIENETTWWRSRLSQSSCRASRERRRKQNPSERPARGKALEGCPRSETMESWREQGIGHRGHEEFRRAASPLLARLSYSLGHMPTSCPCDLDRLSCSEVSGSANAQPQTARLARDSAGGPSPNLSVLPWAEDRRTKRPSGAKAKAQTCCQHE
ncbi:hypothetical protein BDY21DRAFT_72345 [Lineolata rhizophorae]|uniref:Uncharacterized protein n=1 Tax=Lineolata rhizophorae TaxID=578093 RepID=A0A6A6NUK5_9PEZI|nr:hypothetical protein BDY21DRAFT_72345 [Lineolata rhizophorae]